MIADVLLNCFSHAQTSTNEIPCHKKDQFLIGNMSTFDCMKVRSGRLAMMRVASGLIFEAELPSLRLRTLVGLTFFKMSSRGCRDLTLALGASRSSDSNTGEK